MRVELRFGCGLCLLMLCLWRGISMGGRRRLLRWLGMGPATTGRWMCRARRWGRRTSLFCLMRRSRDGMRSGWILMPGRSRQMPAGNLNGIVASRDTAYESGTYTTPLWNEAVLYELHIPTFNGSAGSPGTFDTAMVRLPDLGKLGVNAIEFMPLGQFSGSAGTGYNPGYIFAVEDEYGGADGFRIYVNAAHSLGIALILDVVYNHVDGLDLWQFDGWSIDGVPCSWCLPHATNYVNGGIYFFQDGRAHTPFSHARFDVGRPEVCRYLFDNVTGCLEKPVSRRPALRFRS